MVEFPDPCLPYQRTATELSLILDKPATCHNFVRHHSKVGLPSSTATQPTDEQDVTVSLFDVRATLSDLLPDITASHLLAYTSVKPHISPSP